MSFRSQFTVTAATRVYVAGHRGMVGSALVRRLQAAGCEQILTRSRERLDLRDPQATQAFLADARPELIFMAAARVGGIQANDRYGADFLHDNLMLAASVIHGAHRADVQRLVYLGSNCAYPRDCPQPMPESALLTGPLEPTNEPYAIAKIAGIKLCESYRRQHGRDYASVMPCALYGPNDNYDPAHSHVLPALIRKAHEAKLRGDDELVLWGSGTPRREFMHVDDLADACLHLVQRGFGDGAAGSWINVGCGEDLSIRELAELVMDVVGFRGRIVFDAGKPDGTPRKLLDATRLHATGWRARTGLREGIRRAYESSPLQR